MFMLFMLFMLFTRHRPPSKDGGQRRRYVAVAAALQ
jgi:hypothetical protein